MTINLYRKIFHYLKKNKSCHYLKEGQPWEQALLYNWQKNKFKGKTYGYAHTTVNYWHLNYFNDVKSIKKKQILYPYKILISGTLAKKNLIKYGIKNLLEVENLRYSYRDEKKFQNKSKKRNKYKKLLFLGDAFEKTNDRILNLAKKVQSYSNKKYFIAFKPYPADIKKYHNLKKIHITENTLPNLFNEFDLFIISRSSAASIECLIKKKSVFIYLERDEIDTSPIFSKNFKNYDFDHDNFNRKFSLNKKITLTYNLMKIDRNLNKWEKILKKLI